MVRKCISTLHIKTKVLSDRGQGLGYARKLVVENARADYIAFIDADQYLHPSFLKEAIRYSLNDHKACVVRGVVGFTPSKSTPAKLSAYEACTYEVPEQIDVWAFGIGGSLLRKSAILEAGNFDPRIKFVGEDTDIAFRMIKQGWILKNCRQAIFYNQPRATWKALYKQMSGFADAASTMGKKYVPLSKKRLLADISLDCCLSIRCVIRTFRLTHDLRCVLLPIKHVFTGFSYFVVFALR